MLDRHIRCSLQTEHLSLGFNFQSGIILSIFKIYIFCSKIPHYFHQDHRNCNQMKSAPTHHEQIFVRLIISCVFYFLFLGLDWDQILSSSHHLVMEEKAETSQQSNLHKNSFCTFLGVRVVGGRHASSLSASALEPVGGRTRTGAVHSSSALVFRVY